MSFPFAWRAVAFAGSVWLAACAAETEDAAVTQNAVTHGTRDAQHAGVVALIDTAGALRCSGTLIANRVVLTAAHCLVQDEPQLCARFETDGKRTEIRVEHAAMHPRFQVLEPLTAEYVRDLALLRLTQPVQISPHVLATSAIESGLEVNVVGYGRSSAAHRDEGTHRQSGSSIVTDVAPDIFSIAPYPSQPCAYDSGGPVFVERDGSEEIVGVTSRGDADCMSGARATRVDAHEAFVASFLTETEASGATQDADCRLATENVATPAEVGCSVARSSSGGMAWFFTLALTLRFTLRRRFQPARDTA